MLQNIAHAKFRNWEHTGGRQYTRSPTSLCAAELDSQKRCTFLNVRLEQSDRPLRKVPDVLSDSLSSGSSSI